MALGIKLIQLDCIWLYLLRLYKIINITQFWL